MACGIRNVVALRETEKALYCQVETGKCRWVPKSQIQFNSEVKRAGDRGTLVVTDWWFQRYQEEHNNNEYREFATNNAPPTIELNEAKRVYRQLVLEFHPDRNPDDRTKLEVMKCVNRLMDAVNKDLRRG